MQFLQCEKAVLWDATLQSLPGHLFKHYFNLNCLADPWGWLPSIQSIARNFGIRPCRANQILARLIEHGLVEIRAGGYFALVELHVRRERTSVNAVLKKLLEFVEQENKKREEKPKQSIWENPDDFDAALE